MNASKDLVPQAFPDLRKDIKAWPLLGHALAVRRNVLEFLILAQSKHPFGCRTRLGPEEVVLVFHPEAVAHVLVKNSKNYSKNSFIGDSLKTILGNGLLSNDGDSWARQRKSLQPLFSLERAKASEPEIEGYVSDWVLDLSKRTGEDLNFSTELMQVTRKIISQIILGEDLSRYSSEIDGEFDFLTQFVYSRSVNPLSLPLWVPLPSNLRFLNLRRRLNKIIYAFIDQDAQKLAGTRKADRERDGLLSRLNEIKDENGHPLSRKCIRDEVMTLFLAGHETTANSVVWFLQMAYRHPEWITQLRAENDPQGPKLQAFIHECYRLYSPAWSLVRRTIQDDQIGSYSIRAGTLVVLSQWATHRHPDFWPEPERFKPERFLTPPTDPLLKYAFFPFGAGPRVCIGSNIALILVRRLFFHFIQNFNIKTLKPSEIVPHPTTSLAMKDSLWLNISVRSAPQESAVH